MYHQSAFIRKAKDKLTKDNFPTIEIVIYLFIQSFAYVLCGFASKCVLESSCVSRISRRRIRKPVNHN